MNRFALAMALTLGLASPALAEPLLGLWRTAADDNGNSGLIQVAPCGGKICGTLIKAYGPNGAEIASPNIGRQIIFDTVPQGGGSYRGKVFSPDRGKTYNSRLTLSGNNLGVEGCVLGICRNGGNWQKVQ